MLFYPLRCVVKFYECALVKTEFYILPYLFIALYFTSFLNDVCHRKMNGKPFFAKQAFAHKLVALGLRGYGSRSSFLTYTGM